MRRRKLCCIMIFFSLLMFNICRSEPPTKEDLNEVLLYVAHYGTVEDVEKLIQMGADINTKNKFGSTPFQIAVSADNVRVAEFFLEHGQNPNRFSDDPPEMTPLIETAANHQTELFDLLLFKFHADPNYKTVHGLTALMSAIIDPGMFRKLINKKADIHARDNYGRSVLIYAALMGPEEVVLVLCKMGADPNVKDNEGHTAIWYAQERSRSNIVELLKNCSKKQGEMGSALD